jgi:hypothetical protein
MDALDFGGLLEWVQGIVEARWGKFWSWVAYFGLLAMLVAGAIWLLYYFVGHARS